jgi:hypothetical protein
MLRTLEQSTMRKVYLRLLPFAVLSYVLAYIDRINVSFAGLTGSYAGGLYGLALFGLVAAIVCAFFLHIPRRTSSAAATRAARSAHA